MRVAGQLCMLMAVLSTGMAKQQDVLVVKKDSQYIASLNKRTFESNIASGFSENWIVLFCVDWYAPCADLQRSYMMLAERYDAQQNNDMELLRSTVRFASVDCAVDKVLCNSQLVDDYPTLRHYREGNMLASWRGRGKLNESKAVAGWLDKTLAAPTRGADPTEAAHGLLTASERALLLRLIASAVAISASICWGVSRGVELWVAAASVWRQEGATSDHAGRCAASCNSSLERTSGSGVESRLPRQWLQRGGLDL